MLCLRDVVVITDMEQERSKRMLETGRTRQISGFKEYRNVKQKLKAEIEQLEQIIKTAGGRL